MKIAPFSFKEFDAGVVARDLPHGMKPLLPGGRRKEGAPPHPPAPPTFSEEQLKAAERESYKKGFLEGTQEGKNQAANEQAGIDRQLTDMTSTFATSVAPILENYRQLMLQMKQDLPKVALAIARKVAGDALAENAQAAVDEMALRCVETMIAEPKLTITVHESLAETLEKKIKDMAARVQSATDIVVVRDAAMATTDCRIEWKHGAMERHTGQLWEAIEKAVGNMAAAAPRDTEKQMENLNPAGRDSGSAGSDAEEKI